VVILLRGLGRLDVFPANDTSVAGNLTLVGGPAALHVETLLDTLGPDRGMLCYHLLLGRLETRGGSLSFALSAPQAANPPAGSSAHRGRGAQVPSADAPERS
jgi:hypothetical protein